MAFDLPQTATAPFCPSEVKGCIEINPQIDWKKKLLLFVGPGLLISVGYMDPGNWATDIEAGAKYGYALLFVILLSSLAAMFLQCLSAKAGIASGQDLAQLCRKNYSAPVNFILWILAELAIIATDVAEVLGSALAFKLILNISLLQGVFVTALDTLIVLGLKGKGFRRIEAIILGLISTIGICFFIELLLIKPDMAAVLQGYTFSLEKIRSTVTDTGALYLAIGIIGATVMPHNLYLHSSIVQTRTMGSDVKYKKQAYRLNVIDTVSTLSLAFLINSAILILAAAAFHQNGHVDVKEIDQAFHLLDPVVGSGLAAILFAVALLAAGQSSTFTGTIAGQVILEGFLDLKIPCWKRRLITRALALLPAAAGVYFLGENSSGRLLVLSQVILSLQLPFVIFPLVQLASRREVMGEMTIGSVTKFLAWSIFLILAVANLAMLSGVG